MVQLACEADGMDKPCLIEYLERTATNEVQSMYTCASLRTPCTLLPDMGVASTTGDSAAGRVEVVVIEEGTAGGGDAAGDEDAAEPRPTYPLARGRGLAACPTPTK